MPRDKAEPGASAGKARSEDRSERLAEALRVNLVRRKELARARSRTASLRDEPASPHDDQTGAAGSEGLNTQKTGQK